MASLMRLRVPAVAVFHDAFLAQGSAPFPALRRLMLDHAAGDVLE